MFVVVCYDIPSNKRRSRVAQALEGFGYRVQKSVFECEVTPRQMDKMKERIARRTKASEDSVRYYTLCASCLGKVEVAGIGEVRRAEPFFVV